MPVVVATFDSKSQPGVVYTVVKREDGSLSCDCPAWVYNKERFKTCPHTRALAEEGRPHRGRNKKSEGAAL